MTKDDIYTLNNYITHILIIKESLLLQFQIFNSSLSISLLIIKDKRYNKANVKFKKFIPNIKFIHNQDKEILYSQYLII